MSASIQKQFIIKNKLTNRSNSYIVIDMDYENDKKKLMEIFHQRFKKYGLKITPQRTAVYQELIKTKNHPSAEIIYRKLYRKLPNISFDTVNRTLIMFSKIGIVNIVEGYGQPKRYDLDTDSHHHFRCMQCNKIIDFHSKEYDNISVPAEIQKQFTVFNKKVVLEGLCDRCKKKGLSKEVLS